MEERQDVDVSDRPSSRVPSDVRRTDRGENQQTGRYLRQARISYLIMKCLAPKPMNIEQWTVNKDTGIRHHGEIITSGHCATTEDDQSTKLLQRRHKTRLIRHLPGLLRENGRRQNRLMWITGQTSSFVESERHFCQKIRHYLNSFFIAFTSSSL